MNQNYQRLAIWAAMFVLVLALWNLVSSTTKPPRATDVADDIGALSQQDKRYRTGPKILEFDE